MMMKTDTIRPFSVFQCQITFAIVTPQSVNSWLPMRSLNFNEDEY